MRVVVALIALAMFAATASAQEPAGSLFAAGVAAPTEVGRFDISRLEATAVALDAPAFAEAPAARQAPPAQRPAPPPPPPVNRRRRGSMVGYIENASVESRIRVRFDTAFHDTAPDRAEFFYAKCGCYADLAANDPAFDPDTPGPRPGAANDVNFQHLDFWGEYAVQPRLSVFGQLPIRWLQPQSFIPGTGGSFPDQSGIGDIRAGARFAVADADDHTLTVQAQFFLPSGDAAKGMGTDHASFEPELLYFRQLNEIVTLESQFGVWFPFGGSAGLPTSVDDKFSGNVLNYGIGSGFDLLRKNGLRLGPVVELVGWHVFNGFQTATVADAGGTNIVNLKIGGRLTMNDLHSVYVGYGHHLTDDTWYDDIVRFEYRLGF